MRPNGRIFASLVAIGMLLAIPSTQALLNRNFLGAVPAAQWTSEDGAGIFDPVSPSNTCAALLGVRSEDGQSFYYTNLRMATAVFESGFLPGASEPAVGTPADDCFAVGLPGNWVGVGEYEVVWDYFFDLEGILGATETAILSNDTWEAGACPIANAIVVQGSPGVLPVSGVSLQCTAATPITSLSDFVSTTAPGTVSTAFDEPNVLDLFVPTTSAVGTCYTASMFDSAIGVITAPVSDDTWFVVTTPDTTAANGALWSSAQDAAGNLMNLDNLVADAGCFLGGVVMAKFDKEHRDVVADSGTGKTRNVEIDKKPGAAGLVVRNEKGDPIRVRYVDGAGKTVGDTETVEEGFGTSGVWPAGATKAIVETAEPTDATAPKKAVMTHEQFK